MSLLLEYYTTPGSNPPPYAPTSREDHGNLGLPLSLTDVPHRYYPMPSRMDGHHNSNSLFSPESESTAATSVYDPVEPVSIPEPPLSAAPSHVSSLLPTYTTGASVTPMNASSAGSHSDALTSALTLRITNQPSRGTAYDLGDIIQGTILFAPWKKPDGDDLQEISSVMVVLQCVESGVAGGGKMNTRTFRLTYHIVPDMAMPPDGMVSTGYIYSFPFSLQIPHIRQEDDGPCQCHSGSEQPPEHCMHSSLPPTFPSGSEREPADTPTIKYQLCAMVRGPHYNTLTHETKTTTICRTVQDIHLIPSYTSYPASAAGVPVRPISVAVDIQPRPGFFKSSKKLCGGKLEVSIPGQGVDLAVDRGASMLVPLDLRFVGAVTGTTTPQIQRVTLELCARTSYSTSRKGMSLLEARKNKPAFAKTTFHSIPLAVMDGSQCQWTKLSTHFSASLSVPFEWRPTTAIPPAFKSCTVEREYKFGACVYIEGLRTPLRLQVPAQVVSSFHPRSLILV